MKIKKKIQLMVGISIISLLALMYIISSTILVSGFKVIEQKEIEKNIIQAINAIQRENYELHKLSIDWAEWDDSYYFMDDKNQNYIDSNYVDSTFQRLKLNSVIYINASGDSFFMKGYDFRENLETSVSKDLVDEMSRNYRNGMRNMEGVIRINNKAFLINSHTILKSDSTGPEHGILVMVRDLDDSMVNEIAQTSHTNMKLINLNEAILAEFFSGESSDQVKNFSIKPLNNAVINGYGILQDIYGKPAFFVKVEIQRDIYQQGLKSRLYLIITILACGLIFGILLFFSLNRFFIEKLVLLNNKMDSALSDENHNKSLYVPGNDEISDFSKKMEQNFSLLRDSIEEKKVIIEKQKKTEEELKQSKVAILNMMEDLQEALKKESNQANKNQ